MRSYRIVYVDAFTRTPLAGNPCAVFPDARGLSAEEMQAIACETNLSETSFVLPSEVADFKVRYFTPRHELPFAGHPTIATAFTLAQEGLVQLQQPVTRIHLEFKVGVLPVEITAAAAGGPERVIMTQRPPVFGATFAAADVAACFRLQPSDLRPDCPPQVVSTGVPFLLVPAASLELLGRVEMDRPALAALCDRAGVSAAFMFCLRGFSPEADTHARLLDPRGASEDPYTGSAAGCMGVYVVRYGLRPGPVLVAEQGHFVGRPGVGVLEVTGSPAGVESIRLGGAAVKVMEGVFYVEGTAIAGSRSA